jgi:hypothetical protein
MTLDLDNTIREALEGRYGDCVDPEAVMANLLRRRTRRRNARRAVAGVIGLAVLTAAGALVGARDGSDDMIAGTIGGVPALWPSPVPEGLQLVEAGEGPGVTGEAWAALAVESPTLPLTSPRVLVVVRRGVSDQERTSFDLGEEFMVGDRDASISHEGGATTVAYFDMDTLIAVRAWGLDDDAVGQVAQSVRVGASMESMTFEPPGGLSVQWSGGAPSPLLGPIGERSSVFEGPSGSLAVEVSAPASARDVAVEVFATQIVGGSLTSVDGRPAVRGDDDVANRSEMIWRTDDGYWVRLIAEGAVREQLDTVATALVPVPEHEWRAALASSGVRSPATTP